MNWRVPGLSPVLAGLGIAGLSLAPAWLMGDATQPGIVFGLACLVGSMGAMLLARTAERASARFGSWSLCALAALLAYVALRALVLRHETLPWIGRAADLVLRPSLDVHADPDGVLSIDSDDGLLRVAPTYDKVGLLPFGALWSASIVLLWLTGARARSLVAITAATGVAMVLRLAMVAVTLSGQKDLLSSSASFQIAALADPSAVLPWSLVLGLSAGFLAGPGLAVRVGRSSRAATAARAAALVCGCALVAFWTFHHPAGPAKRGRVLVDDRFSGIWEPASRRLTPQWFGDFATYSFTSAVEWLGYHFPVTVNSGREYDDAFLSRYDVLIIKTPSEEIPKAEREAIVRFVEKGGGLMLIGDHTDLLGTSTRLNELSEKAGIQFRFDEVSDVTGAFSMYEDAPWSTHPAARSVRAMEFMTSCSLALDLGASAVLTLPHQQRGLGDYANYSFFASKKNDPEVAVGPLVLAAAGRIGAGTVLAFTDSTVLSSFALFTYDRAEFLRDSVAFLNRTSPGTTRSLLLAGTLVGLVLLALGLARLLAPPRPGLIAGCAVLGLVPGAWIGHRVTRWSHPVVAAVRAPPRVALVQAGSEAIYPPVLGSNNADASRSYDTLLAAIPRSGVFPCLVDHLQEALGHPAALVLNPYLALEPGEGESLRQWVEGGGKLVVALRRDHYHLDALRSVLERVGVTLGSPANALDVRGARRLASSGTRLEIFGRDVGKGHVVLVIGAEWWTRKELGHAFSIPDADTRACYEDLDRILASYLGVAPEDRRLYEILEATEPLRRASE